MIIYKGDKVSSGFEFKAQIVRLSDNFEELIDMFEIGSTGVFTAEHTGEVGELYAISVVCQDRIFAEILAKYVENVGYLSITDASIADTAMLRKSELEEIAIDIKSARDHAILADAQTRKD